MTGIEPAHITASDPRTAESTAWTISSPCSIRV